MNDISNFYPNEMLEIKDFDINILINARVIRMLKTYSITVTDFIKNFNECFDVKAICDILKINKNRYNYLKRHGQLNWHIAKIGGYVGVKTNET
jgi:hypothetical protein